MLPGSCWKRGGSWRPGTFFSFLLFVLPTPLPSPANVLYLPPLVLTIATHAVGVLCAEIMCIAAPFLCTKEACTAGSRLYACRKYLLPLPVLRHFYVLEMFIHLLLLHRSTYSGIMVKACTPDDTKDTTSVFFCL